MIQSAVWAERRGVPHHLLDVWEVTERASGERSVRPIDEVEAELVAP